MIVSLARLFFPGSLIDRDINAARQDSVKIDHAPLSQLNAADLCHHP